MAMMTTTNEISPARKKKVRRKNQPVAYLYLGPALISIAILGIAPLLYTVYIAFTNFDMYHFTSYQFVGLQNFIDIINGPYLSVFEPVFVWTIVFAVTTTLANYLVGLFVAVLLNNEHMKESNIYRAILIVPWAVPALITQLSWSNLLNKDYGPINQFLHIFGIHSIPWLTDPFWAKVSVLLVNLWLGYPYMMSVCLGALQAVPKDLYEAAQIDGANWWQQFFYVTIPAIWKITIPLIIPSFAFNFNNFNAIYALTQGGPARPDTQFAGYTDILISAAYKMSLTFNKFEIAAALSVLVFILVGAISLIQMKASGAFQEAD